MGPFSIHRIQNSEEFYFMRFEMYAELSSNGNVHVKRLHTIPPVLMQLILLNSTFWSNINWWIILMRKGSSIFVSLWENKLENSLNALVFWQVMNFRLTFTCWHRSLESSQIMPINKDSGNVLTDDSWLLHFYQCAHQQEICLCLWYWEMRN